MADYNLAYPDVAIDAILNTAYYLQEAGYIFRGSASDYSGTPSKREWVIAPAGFSGYGLSSAVPQGSIGICLYNGTSWTGKIINVVTIDNYPTHDSTNAVTSGGMWNALDDLGDGIWATLQSFVIQDGTTSANQGTQIKFDVKMTDGQQVQHLISSFGILAATTAKAGLMSAADKAKVDAFLDNLRSLSFTDTTPGADAGTKIVETLKATIGGTEEAITALTILAATTSKAGLLSASDKSYIDSLPSSLTSINADISKLLAMLGYYECSTAAGTAAKTISASGYVLTNGGCIRIKMTNANTADNVTLNINSTGAKALYYDGAQASSSNSWDAGDILEVFYDGTQYQCASGGGGKFATGENVKDVSISNIIERNGNALITNGAVYGLFSQYDNSYNSSAANIAGILKWDGTIGTYNNWYTSPKISVVGAASIVATGLYYSASTYMGFALYDENDAVLYRNTGTSISISLADYPTASYMRFCRSTQTVSITVTFNPFLAQVTSKQVEKGDNMPVSGGAVFNDILSKIEEISSTYNATISNTILKANGDTQNFNGYSTSDYIEVNSGCRLVLSGIYTVVDNYYRGVCFYDENKALTSAQPPIGTLSIDMKDYPDVAFIRISGNSNPKVVITVGYDLIGAVQEMEPTVNTLGQMFDVSSMEFGIDSQASRNSTLATNMTIATVPNSVCAEDGVLNEIIINVLAAGKCHFGVGVLDQSLIPVISREFTVDLPSAGYNKVNISDMQVSIFKGEQIFFMYRAQDEAQIRYSISTDSADASLNCPYGTLSGLSYYGISGQYLIFTMAYTITVVDSVFAMKNELVQLHEKVSALEGASFVYDNNGNPYKLRVSNGEIVAVSQLFNNVVILGNSLTWHEYNASIGWYGRDRSMASTTNYVSWPNLLQKILRKKRATATVQGVMMRNWETAGDGNRNINNIPSTKALLDAALTAETDLIMFRCGENGTVSNSDTYKSEILSLIDYCLQTAPAATVVICGLFWPNATKDAAILGAANARGYTYITAGRGFSGYQEINGDYMVDSDDNTEKRIGSACLSHTADHGFYLWANHVANNLGYSAEVLDELHKITINSTLQNGYRIKDTESPYNSLVTILVSESSQPTISVVDASGNTIQTSVHALSDVGTYTYAFTFIQPDSDVTVTLS